MNKILLLLLLLTPALFWTGCPGTTDAVAKSSRTNSQQSIRYEDYVYDPDFKTIQMYRGNDERFYPVLYIGDATPIRLEFDEIMPVENRQSDLYVDIVSCDANWEPSNVLPIEFYEGYTQDFITEYQRSDLTKVPYMHYRYHFPQEGEAFKMSGNYILKVFRNGNPNDLVFTRRFVVVENAVGLELTRMIGDASRRLRLSQINFELNPDRLQTFNPANDFKVMLMQNGRWDNIHKFDQPTYFANKRFEYQTQLTKAFSGGCEFRRNDLRSVRLYSENVRLIESEEDMHYVHMFQDERKDYNTFDAFADMNGTYVVAINEFPQAPDMYADYVTCHYRLSTTRDMGDVYIMGGFTNWQLLDQYKMEYIEATSTYEANILMKQGLYDYQYAVKVSEDELSERRIEGNWDNGENFYTVLVYYKAPADRNDRLVGLMHVNYVD